MFKIKHGVLSFPIITQEGAALADLILQTIHGFGALDTEDKEEILFLSEKVRSGQSTQIDYELELVQLGTDPHAFEYKTHLQKRGLKGRFVVSCDDFDFMCSGKTEQEAMDNMIGMVADYLNAKGGTHGSRT